MIANDNKTPVVLIGNSFKYEIESILKLFFNTARFNFTDDRAAASGEAYFVAEVAPDALYAEVKLNGDEPVKASAPLGKDEDENEFALCRMIYHILCDKTGVVPPWGMATGIRPIKKFVDLIRQGLPREEVLERLGGKYEISKPKLDIAYETAVNQIPILDKIDPYAASLYVSIPFCPTRCSYCSFVSHSMDSAVKLMPQYVEALCRELAILGDMVRESGVRIDTIYFGGGTPTSISARDLRRIMEAVRDNFDLDSVREYSVEAGRPDTITEEKLRVIKDLGAERISVNPQTLNDDVLKVIGRKHTGKDAIEAFELAKKVGFKNINTDLIAGLPTESAESFRNTLDKIIELDPQSVTVHTLTLKRAASLFEQTENIGNPAAEMVEYSIEKLMKNGYLPYYMYRQKNTVDNLENIGYAKKGFECYYNIFIMDETQTILGAGCAASAKLLYPNGRIERVHNYKFPYEYINRFDELMKKKEEIAECLKRIGSLK